MFKKPGLFGRVSCLPYLRLPMKIITKIASLLFVPIIIWSGMGFSVSQHYCLGMLKSESFYSPADKCANHQNQDSCAPKEFQFESNCCKDQNLNIKALEFKRFSNLEFVSLAKPLGVTILPYSFKDANAKQPLFKDHLNLPPPKKLLITIQRFQI